MLRGLRTPVRMGTLPTYRPGSSRVGGGASSAPLIAAADTHWVLVLEKLGPPRCADGCSAGERALAAARQNDERAAMCSCDSELRVAGGGGYWVVGGLIQTRFVHTHAPAAAPCKYPNTAHRGSASTPPGFLRLRAGCRVSRYTHHIAHDCPALFALLANESRGLGAPHHLPPHHTSNAPKNGVRRHSRPARRDGARV